MNDSIPTACMNFFRLVMFGNFTTKFYQMHTTCFEHFGSITEITEACISVLHFHGFEISGAL